MAHPVGFELHHFAQARLGNLLVVSSVILAGKGVVASARRRDETAELARPDARRSLEHHVLQKVCNAGCTVRFIHAARVIPDHVRDRRRAAVFLDDHPQPVGQTVFKGIGQCGARQKQRKQQGLQGFGHSHGQGRQC